MEHRREFNYKNVLYFIDFFQQVTTSGMVLRVYSTETRYMQSQDLSWNIKLSERELMRRAMNMISCIHFRKYTPVDVKIEVVTSSLIGELIP